MQPQPPYSQLPKEIQVRINEAEMKGVYANFMRVFHTKEEFILDFGNILPDGGVITARIITSPGHLKRIVSALKENLEKYEQNFGKIEEADAPKEDFGFSA